MTEMDALIRVVIAAVLGGLLGLEREVSLKPAGLRTHMLVAKGSALFMIGSMLVAQDAQTTAFAIIDPTRIGSTIVTGVGFLGAGMILRSGDRIQGLTTAAGIWVAASIGMLVGAGYLLISIAGTLLTLFIMVGLRLVERRLLRPKLADQLQEEDEGTPAQESQT
jgi:putative Mg2+ transporter-C (MgtC) family protein